MSGLAAGNGQPPRRGAPPRAIIGVVAEEDTRKILSDAAIARGIAFAFEIGGIEVALAGLQPDETADCVIIDLDGAPDAVDDVAVLATGLPHYAELILLGIFTEAQAHELIQAGASLCVAKPLTESMLNHLFGGVPMRQPQAPPAPPAPQPAPAAPQPRWQQPAEERRALPYHPSPAEPESALARVAPGRFNPTEAPVSYGTPPPRPGPVQGRVICIVGCRGGVGASSIAIGLAWLLAEEMGRNTALLDLDPFFGSIALALNLDPGDALQQALERPTRIDAVFLDRAVRKVGQNLYVLGSEHSLEQPIERDPAGPAALVKSLAARHERVIVDLPRCDPEIMRRVMALSAEIVLATDLSLAGARDAMRLMALVRGAAAYARVRIVAGGARDAGKSPILTPSEFRRAVGAAIDITIGHDSETASDAARSGRPIPKVFPRSTASKALRNLAQSLESRDQAEPRRKLLWWKR